MEAAGDKGAQEVEREHKGLVGKPRLEDARRLEEPQVRRHAGVGEDRDVRAPAEFDAEPLGAGGWRAPWRIAGVAGPAAARRGRRHRSCCRSRDTGLPGGSPVALGHRRAEAPDRGKPRGRRRLVKRAPRQEGERDGVAASSPKDRDGPKRAGPAQEGGVASRRASPNGVMQPQAAMRAGAGGVGHAATGGPAPVRTGAWTGRRARG